MKIHIIAGLWLEPAVNRRRYITTGSSHKLTVMWTFSLPVFGLRQQLYTTVQMPSSSPPSSLSSRAQSLWSFFTKMLNNGLKSSSEGRV
jgi:hypothetical protein